MNGIMIAGMPGIKNTTPRNEVRILVCDDVNALNPLYEPNRVSIVSGLCLTTIKAR